MELKTQQNSIHDDDKSRPNITTYIQHNSNMAVMLVTSCVL